MVHESLPCVLTLSRLSCRRETHASKGQSESVDWARFQFGYSMSHAKVKAIRKEIARVWTRRYLSNRRSGSWQQRWSLVAGL